MEVMYLDPTKKQDITKAHAAVSLEYEPTIVSLVLLAYLYLNLQFIYSYDNVMCKWI